MLTPANKARASRRVALPQSVPAPLLGWNTRDPYEAMDPRDAIRLDNWFPDFGGVKIRNGTQPFALGDGAAAVETLAVLQTASFNRFLAAWNGDIYDISAGGAFPTPITGSGGFSANRWQIAVFQKHLFLVNGADLAQIYDGTTLAATGFTGVTTSTLSGVQVIHNRLYFWTGLDPSFWYGPVNGIAGALSNFDLSTVSKIEGNLVAVEVLSYDGGTGIESYTCFFMSSGELLLYSGTDPSNANNWALVGSYVLPPPIGVRAITRFGGDIYIATQNDHLQISKILIALKLGETVPRSKISGAVTTAFAAGGGLFGWNALYYPRGTSLIFNIPNHDGSFDQHVYNTSLQAWCRFRRMNARCWAVYNDLLYFGKSNGEVVQADIGSVDSDAAGSRPIIAGSQQAWQDFGSPLKKRLTLSRVVVQTNNQGASYRFRIGTDFSPFAFNTPIALPPIGTPWGVGIWGQFTWNGTFPNVDSDWHVEGGEAFAFSWGIMANSQAPTLWVKTDLMLEPGVQL